MISIRKKKFKIRSKKIKSEKVLQILTVPFSESISQV